MEIKVKDIVKICGAKLLFGEEEIICENFSKDTRTLQKDDVYVGIKGEKFDGNTLYEQALEKGAKVCILQDVTIPSEVIKQYEDRCVILVKDTIKALQQIASYKRSLYDIPVIAITGSVGKTSTKDLVASVVGTSYHVLKTEGNLNNHIGLPFTILQLKDHDALVVEMGMNHLGEISVLSQIAKPTIAIITNVGTAHIGNLGSRENILKAKLEILEGMQENGILIINNDNDLLHDWQEKSRKNQRVVTYGIQNKSDIEACNITYHENASEFQIKDKQKVKVPVGGEHFVYNALCAITVGELLEIPFERIQEGIAHFSLSQNRMEVTTKKGITLINDCYNANYDSMKAAIETIAKMEGKRKIAILGDMLELGEFSKELHEKVGEVVAKNHIDQLITVGTEAKNIAKSACENGLEPSHIHICENNQEAMQILQNTVKEGDVLLVKASNAMKFVEIVKYILQIIESVI